MSTYHFDLHTIESYYEVLHNQLYIFPSKHNLTLNEWNEALPPHIFHQEWNALCYSLLNVMKSMLRKYKAFLQAYKIKWLVVNCKTSAFSSTFTLFSNFIIKTMKRRHRRTCCSLTKSQEGEKRFPILLSLHVFFWVKIFYFETSHASEVEVWWRWWYGSGGELEGILPQSFLMQSLKGKCSKQVPRFVQYS